MIKFYDTKTLFLTALLALFVHYRKNISKVRCGLK